jgi:4-hydroxy-3-polyprenylbenzoate decarboxylase
MAASAASTSVCWPDWPKTVPDHRRRAVALAITGASGAPYALRLIEQLLTAGERIELMISTAAEETLAIECSLELPSDPEERRVRLLDHLSINHQARLTLHGLNDWLAPVASGSSAPRAMVICPCSMGTVSAIAHGLSDNLIERAADVAIKERRQLILVPRETPLSAIHLENLLILARLGVTILPPSPGFYHRPASVGDLVDFVVARILDHLAIEQQLAPRWGDGREKDNR